MGGSAPAACTAREDPQLAKLTTLMTKKTIAVVVTHLELFIG
jgi:hypothetical protein